MMDAKQFSLLRGSRATAVALSLAAMAQGATAATVTTTLNLSGPTADYTSLSFSSGALTMTATGTSSFGSTRYVAQGSAGLGVDNNMNPNNGTIISGSDQLNLSFNLGVVVDQIVFSYFNTGDSFTFNSSTNGTPVQSMGATLIPGLGFGKSTSLGTYTFASGSSIASLFTLGAAAGSSFEISSLTVTYDSPIAAVPLPASWVLLLAALGGLFALNRRRVA